MKKLATIACASAILLATLAAMAPDARASYSLSMSGSTKFVGQAWTAEGFVGFVTVGLSADSQSYADVEIGCVGTMAPWVSWQGATHFRLQPGEQLTVRFNVTFPSSAPGVYDGSVYATGTPAPEAGGGGATAPGMISTSLGAQVLVQASTYLSAYAADATGARAEVTNNANATFVGTLYVELRNLGLVQESQNQTISNLSSLSSAAVSMAWATQTHLGETYYVTFNLTDSGGTTVDYKEIDFYLPTPADITDLWHDPQIVYADVSATIYARVQSPQNGQTSCTLHYRVNGGAAATAVMAYDAATSRYHHAIANATYDEGDVVDYWVTSSSGTYSDTSDTKSFPVFSNMAPDVQIIPDEIFLVVPDPNNITENTTFVVRVTVRNVGRGEAKNFLVQMLIDGANAGNRTVSSLQPSNRTDVDFYWKPSAGNYTLSFVADVSNVLVEPNEDDNYASKQASIRPRAVPPAVAEEDDEAQVASYRMIFIAIIILAVLLLLLFLRKRKIVAVVAKVVSVRRKDGTKAFKYVCADGEGNELGTTLSTNLEVGKGDALELAVSGLVRDYDDTVMMSRAKVIKKTDADPTGRARLLKMAK